MDTESVDEDVCDDDKHWLPVLSLVLDSRRLWAEISTANFNTTEKEFIPSFVPKFSRHEFDIHRRQITMYNFTWFFHITIIRNLP